MNATKGAKLTMIVLAALLAGFGLWQFGGTWSVGESHQGHEREGGEEHRHETLVDLDEHSERDRD